MLRGGRCDAGCDAHDDVNSDLAITPATAERMAVPRSATLLWIKGGWERGTKVARYDNVARYEERFMTLLEQLKADFGFDEINVVIGRLSDSTYYYSISHDSQVTEHWHAIRAIPRYRNMPL